ncbi:hypothetical protein [Flagellimonas nanhaiensis]|uniref:Uncharacterized protein n=1 Tax=Flagellimonas nanhaiensis TaxID=2292706 RepID=A0A371JTP1_9FLAO|nr:hypothetical protein [Allomuricauda nanhaiensis]RDY61174.1 hypothetical protein DX873_03105 [Allomuricauda nanhaiensis]
MKKALLILLLLPLLIMGQETPQAPIFMNVMLTPHPQKIEAFEAGVAAHNKKYHTEGAGQVSVFWVASGKNSGKYIWSMGPTAWAALDAVNNYDEAHTNDWNTNVAANALPEMETTYWKNHPPLSNFSKNFGLKNLSIFMIDIKRFKEMEFMEVLDRVYKVFHTKDPEHQWGVYFNELSNNEGQDFVWVDFFDKTAWMGREDKFVQWYEEVHGSGSFPAFLKDFESVTNSNNEELWVFRKDLSGASGDVQPRN